jgi:PAS domain S-box-containing protein
VISCSSEFVIPVDPMKISEYLIQPLREDEEFILYRGRPRKGERPSVLFLVPGSRQPAIETLKKIQHEYSLRRELGATWAVRPRALSQHNDTPVLVLEDPGGEPLHRLIRGPMDTKQFFRFAIGLTTAVSQLHAQGLIHKDLKPSNVLVDAATGHVWLTGFGIASRLPRERQSPEPPRFIAGSLAYMAPEQTGHMNRSIDSRSDLYALGVMLYEMLTGVLPFTASDAMEWIHCHLAKQAVPPSEKSKNAPRALSAIIIKLLAKTAEERYQSAAGVKSDLGRCLAEWEIKGRIDEFSLGDDDVSDRLWIPEKLYGRGREINTLLASFDRVAANGKPELVLVSGYSGIGKSSLVSEVHKVLVSGRGLFASGKFDQYRRDVPYATLAQAFQSLIRQLLIKSEAELSEWRDALGEALGPNGRLIVDLVPELGLVIGEQPLVPELPPQEAQRRFQLVFRRFASVFARPRHPLVLFFDDLQWLDAATLDLIEDLLTQPDVRHLMLIGAYRDNEIDSAHPLMRKLRAIRQADAIVQDIRLMPLASEDLGRLVADSVSCEVAQATSLAELLHAKTAGNPFFAIQFISALAEEGLLTFDHGKGRWSWDVDRIRAKGYTDNVVDLLVGRLNRLPVGTQSALQRLACLGSGADFVTLQIVYESSAAEVHGRLWEAVRAGLIYRAENSYNFLHDRVRESAYASIPEELRAETHLRIGKLLAAQTPPEKQESEIFTIVNQLNRGTALIALQEEREQLAELNLTAGERAKASTAYTSALNYLVAGAALLGDDTGERRHELKFQLEMKRAECEFLTGQSAAAEERLTMLSSSALNAIERATVACLQIDLYTVLAQSDRAVAVCLDYLRRLGVEWSSHPTREDVQQGYERIWLSLGDRKIEELVELRLMTDPVSLATLDVLTKAVEPAHFTDENLSSLVICHMVNLSLEHGNSDGSCVAYVYLGMIAGPFFGNYPVGFQFGRLGYDLVEKCGLKRFQARTYLAFGSHVMPWTKPMRACRDLVRRTFEIARKAGDICFAAFSFNNLNTNLLAAGDPLDEVQREAERALDFANNARFGFVVDIITAQLGLVRTLRGSTPEFGHFDDGQFDELRFERHLASDPAALPECFYWIRKLQARFLACDYVSAVEASLKAQRLLWTAPSNLEVAEYHFYGALCRAALWDSASPEQRQQYFEDMAGHEKQLQTWAENCPENFKNRAALVGAEIARIGGRTLDAEHLYEQAIRSAHANGFVHNEALANELAARFYVARGLEKIAHAYLRDARYGYLRWGATGKVRQLDELYSYLSEERLPASTTSTIGTPVRQLDVEAVIKASQALSSEIVLGELVERLMHITVEHAGAERGLLILLRGSEPQIEAEATTGNSGIQVTIKPTAAVTSSLPQTVLHYVIRTRECQVVDDTSLGGWYSDDEYVQQNRPRSFLCLPILKQTKLIGALYLENNLTPRVFTPDRVAVLELLASQGAISLENANLYSELQRSEAFLTQGQSISHTGSFGWGVLSGKIYWSEETFKIFEQDRAVKPTMKSIFQRIHPDDRDRVQQTLDHAVNEKTDFDIEHRLLMPDGSVKHLHAIARASKTSSGNLEYVGAVTDVTTTKRTEETLREREAYFAESQRLAHTGSWALDGTTREARYWSEEMFRIFGFDPRQGLPKRNQWLQRMHPEDREKVKQQASDRMFLQKVDSDIEYRIVLPDGTVKHIHGLFHPAMSPNKDLVEVVGTVVDITERKNTEEALRRSESYLAQAQKLAHIGSWVWEVAGRRALYLSEEWYRIHGFDPKVGMPTWEERLQQVHPEDRARFQATIDRAIAEKSEYDVEFRILPPLSTVRHIHSVGHPVLSPSGELLQFVGVAMDVTERKRAEQERERLQQVQADLAHINRVSMMGEMTASLAHEIKQPMFAASADAETCLRWLARDQPDLAEAQEAALRLMKDVSRASDIINRIVSIFKKRSPQRELVNINGVVQEMITLLHSEASRYSISIHADLTEDLPNIMADRVGIQQVLMNLTLNAIEAMKEKGTPGKLTIATRQDENRQIVVSVTDTGVGVPAGHEEQIFNTFFTSKPQGIGMGLPISRSIIESHGGHLWAASNSGPGATFQFALPLEAAARQHA